MNTKSYIILCVIFLKAFMLHAQFEGYFNKHFDISQFDTYDQSYSLIETLDEYVLAGYALNDNHTKWNMVLSGYNQYGDLQWIKTIGDTTSSYLLGRSGCLIQYDTGRFYSIGLKRTLTENWTHDEVMLSCYNNEIDTLWTEYYGDIVQPYDTAYIFSQVKITNDNNLILAGEWMPEGEPIRMCLIKTDTAGNLLWKQSYGSGSGFYRGFSVINTSDGGFAMGGYLFFIGNDNSGDPMVVKTDSAGNQQWIKNLGGYYSDHVAMLCSTNDGNFVSAYSLADSMLGPNDPISRICLTKMNNQGNIIWSKLYGASALFNYVFNIKELNDGSLIVVGRTTDAFPANSGWLLKLSSEGDSIWYREYKNIYGSDVKNRLYDVIETSDNGLAACGYVYPVPDTYYDDTWIIKLDSNGCDTPDCDPTVVIPNKTEKDNSLYLYPNPARDRFTIESSSFMEKEPLIRIYDLFGRKVKEIKVPKGQDKIVISVSAWRSGMYVAVVKSKGRIVGKGKFVVQ
ncbi:MAG: T9SS type A sorting domain-containing protein [Bacteroidota bacterium]|nr:T9SS type A sorting domain-containing protein [Bacteroidota bacterium]